MPQSNLSISNKKGFPFDFLHKKQIGILKHMQT